jgi:GNAT superfamily N-acetyltransferase
VMDRVSLPSNIRSRALWLFFLRDNTRVGFVCLRFNNVFTAEIHVMGVLKNFQGRGVGKALVSHVKKIAREHGCEYMMVKTLGPSHPDKNYDDTRKFYMSQGFRPLEELNSIWPGNPCLIMVNRINRFD